LDGAGGQVFQSLQAEGEVDAALFADEGVDLVHDDGAHGAQHVAGARAGEEEVERLGRGDQDVRRLLEHRGAGAGRGVAGAHRHAQRRQRLAQPRRGLADARQRRAQVALDVVVQGLEG